MKRLAALLIVLFPLVALNQPIKTNTDSLWEEFRQAETDTGKISLLNDISYKLLFTDKEDTLKMYIDSMYLWSERIGFDKGLHYAYKTRGSYYWFKHKFDSTIYFYKKAEKIAEQLKNKALIADINYNMALAYEMKGDKKEAIFHQRTAVDYFDRFNDRSGVAKSLRGLGGIYSRTGQSEKALSKILTAIHIYDSLGKQGELASTYITLGNLYTNMEEYRKAIDYHEKALKLDLKLDEVSWLPTNIII
ncbi:MAG: tetratricopeptide repeat protein [Bacteroidales bacterium]|nr:tetratricopeptide repeat protein [Bacteroidales bacterium]